MMLTVLMLNVRPKTSNCCLICAESSRVGAMTRQKNGCGSEESSWRIGKANAAVFPLPVFAIAMTSFPFDQYIQYNEFYRYNMYLGRRN